MLRLSANQLIELMRDLWPHLLSELVAVFDEVPANFLLIIEAIKIVDLMSQLNIEDFQMSQWMFLFDGFSHGPLESCPEDMEPEEFNIIKRELNQPYLVKFMCTKSRFGKNHDIALPYSDSKFTFYKSKLGELKEENLDDLKMKGPNITKPRDDACSEIDLTRGPEELEVAATRYATML